MRLNRRRRRRSTALARRAAQAFGSPQDVEWAFDGKDDLWLLQSRPVTSEIRGVPAGPLLGPGPVSETFPEPLTALEEDLWVPPLRRAVREALRLTGSISSAQLDRSPIVLAVDGRVAVDLELFGETPGGPTVGTGLGLRSRLRRLRAAWRVGRLRAALPDLARDLLDRTDDELSATPPLDDLSDRQLLAMLDRCGQALTAVHGHEILIGLLVDPGAPPLTGVSVAFRTLAEARSEGLADEDIVFRQPMVVALVPPHIRGALTLPPPTETHLGPIAHGEGGNRSAVLREALRLRARWLQELAGRAAWVLGERLARSGQLADSTCVRHLRIDELRDLVADPHPVVVGPCPSPFPAPSEPLPARFQLSNLGKPVPVVDSDDRVGTGAGGGCGTGPVHHDSDPPEGAVLVVRTLDPGLAAVLPRLAGLVAETGSVLAHVAILAREAGVPIVVGLSGATARFPPGTVVRVDGSTGEVTKTAEEEDEEEDE